MAKIVASVNVSHVPAIGAAWDNKKSQDPYWKPLFDGFDVSKKWIGLAAERSVKVPIALPMVASPSRKIADQPLS